MWADTYRVIRTALSWWAIPFSGMLLPSPWWDRMDFCHLQKLSRDLSAWWLISRLGCKRQHKTHAIQCDVTQYYKTKPYDTAENCLFQYIQCCIVSYWVVLYSIILCCIISCRIELCCVTSCRMVANCVIWYRVVSCCIILHHAISYRIMSYRIKLCVIVSCRIISCHVMSYRVPIQSYRVMSCPVNLVLSYRMVLYLI